MAEVHGIDEVLKAFAGIVARAEVASVAIVADAAHLIERKAKANFVGAHRRGAPHVGGERPNVVTGTLRRSIAVDGPRRSGTVATARVGPSAVYGRRVELGATGTDSRGRRMNTAPHPFFRPAVDAARSEFHAIAVKRWREAVHKS